MITRIRTLLDKYGLEFNDYKLYNKNRYVEGYVSYNSETICRICVYFNTKIIEVDRVIGFMTYDDDYVFIGLGKLMQCLQENKDF